MTNYVYFINGNLAQFPFAIERTTQSSDGRSWSTPVPITVNGMAGDPNLVDPNVVVLPGGQFLLTFAYINFAQPARFDLNSMYTATSADGINFGDVRKATIAPGTSTIATDPSMVRLADGSFLAAVSHGASGGASEMVLGTSADGRTFTPSGVTLPSAFAGDFLPLSDGGIRIFVPDHGIKSRISHDGGKTWVQEAGLRLAGDYFDPSVVQTGAFQWEMVVKSIIDPATESPNSPGPKGPPNHQVSLATSTDGFNFTVTQANFLVQASVPEIVSNPAITVTPVSGPSKNYALSITAGASSLSLQDKVGPGGTSSVTGGTQLQFTDRTIDTGWFVKTASLSASQIADLTRLYVASFNRAPDALGLDYWGSQLKDGTPLGAIAASFLGQPEAVAAYPAGQSTDAFVHQVYGNVLGRAADAAGLGYWVGELRSGSVGKNTLPLAIVNGVQGTDAQYLANKESVGAHFALTQGLSNPAWAKTVMSGVDGTPATVSAANAQTDAFAATAASGAGVEFVVKILGIAP